MNVPREIREEADAAALKWRMTQNPDVARRINQREEEAFSLGYQARAIAWEARIAKLEKMMNPK